KFPPLSASLGGLLFASNPFFVIVSRSWVVVAYAAAYTPWIFLMLDQILLESKKRVWILYIGLKTLFYFQGNTHLWINLSLIEGLYFLFSLRSRFLSSFPLLCRYAMAQGFVLLCASPQFISNLQAVQNSPYRHGGFPLSHLLTLKCEIGESFLSQLLIFRTETYIGSSSSILHLGGSLILGLLMIRFYREKTPLNSHSKTHLLFFILVLLLSTSLYAAIAWIPPFPMLRWPLKFWAILPFFYVSLFISLLHHSPDFKSHPLWIPQSIGLGILLQFLILINPAHNRPFSDLRIESMEDFSVLWPYQGGRVLPVGSDLKWMKDPQLLTYNFGLWSGIPTLGGYDQLISKTNSKIALGMQITSYLPIQRIESHHSHLDQWGVRYLTASPRDPEITTLLQTPWLQKIAETNRVVVFENRNASPLASFEKQSRIPLEIHFYPNRLEVDLQKQSGLLLLRFASLQNLRASVLLDDNTYQTLKTEASSSENPISIEIPEHSQKLVLKAF
ncbi:MAG: hypothetical protein V4507_16425, partial [Verrucomicrobiota bacterium]